MAINQQTLEGNWNEIKGKIHEKWGQITQDDLQKARGSIDQLVGVIQRKTGEARDRIEKRLGGIVPTEKIPSLGPAIEAAYRRASEGDVVLLSPGCASFDEFTDYKARGRFFKEVVGKL